MLFIDSWRDVVKATLIFSLMFVAVFSRGDLLGVKSQPPTYFSIEATITQNPHWGYYGGYHDVWAKITPELAKIGIELTTELHDDFEWWDQVWEEGWNHTGDTPYPPGGWDVTMLEWWLQPHALEPWFSSMFLNTMIPEEGFNIHPWLNEKADNLALQGMYEFDAVKRQEQFWRWQREFMHDPPIAEIYYPRVFEIIGSYVLGYDPSGCWWYDVKHLRLNATKFSEVVSNPVRLAQGNDTLLYAVTEAVWSWNPMFMETYTEEQIGTLVFDTLYSWSLNYTDAQWLTTGVVEPNYWDYMIKPELAADYPTWMDGPNGPNTRLRVPLREGVLWSDGEPFNATDVKFTFDLTFDVRAKASGGGDFSFLIDSVEYVSDPGGVTDPYTGQGPIDPYAVDFLIKKPHPEFTSVLANDWGGGSIVPWHSLQDVGVAQIRNHVSNYDWTQMLPGTGPYTVTNFVTDDHITLTRNPLHWGYGLGFGPHVTTLILKWIPDAAARKTALQTNTVDFGEYPTASISEYYDMMTWDNVRIFQYDYPASNGVWFNFDNPYLSNRYVRQAIAHAIPYDAIRNQVLPGWGVETAYPGKTYILPGHYYTDTSTGTTVHMFNEDLPPYEYDISKATAYMNMWLYSQPAYAPDGSPEVNLGPVGDADFSGKVNFDDWWIWWENYGKAPGEWPWTPGQDVDPDFNNDNAVTLVDFDRWSLNWGEEYPFAGAR